MIHMTVFWSVTCLLKVWLRFQSTKTTLLWLGKDHGHGVDCWCEMWCELWSLQCQTPRHPDLPLNLSPYFCLCLWQQLSFARPQEVTYQSSVNIRGLFRSLKKWPMLLFFWYSKDGLLLSCYDHWTYRYRHKRCFMTLGFQGWNLRWTKLDSFFLYLFM